MNSEKVVLRGNNTQSGVLRMSKQEAKNVDKNKITHVILKDGTIMNIDDPVLRNKNPFNSSSNSNKILESQPISDGNRISYRRIVEDEDNYRIFESCDKTKNQPKVLRAVNQTTSLKKSPIAFASEPEVQTEVKVQTYCPYCNGEGENVLRSKKVRSFGNKVYSIDPIPGLEKRVIKTVVEENDFGNGIIRADTPVFTFNSGIKKEGSQRFVYCSRGDENIRTSNNCRSCVTTTGGKCCEKCGCSYNDKFCSYCSRPLGENY